MRPTILKLGGSLITRKEEDKPEVNRKTLIRLAKEISESMKTRKMSLIIVHGAGPYGHVPAKEYALTGGNKGRKQVRGMVVTHQRMEELNAEVVGALVDAGLDAMAFQPSAGGVMEDRRLVSFPLESVERMLALGIVPVMYGDVLPELKTGLNILSGDHLVPYLAEKLGADRVVIATSHNGVYDRDPDEKGALKIGVLDERTVAMLEPRKTKGTDVTGGIGRKVRELMALSRHGVRSEIISGNEPGYVKRALLGEEGIGTRILSSVDNAT
ncbi:MAG: isopentenyl phosphate kinase [Candidatus Altiarchaeota archaeon]